MVVVVHFDQGVSVTNIFFVEKDVRYGGGAVTEFDALSSSSTVAAIVGFESEDGGGGGGLLVDALHVRCEHVFKIDAVGAVLFGKDGDDAHDCCGGGRLLINLKVWSGKPEIFGSLFIVLQFARQFENLSEEKPFLLSTIF